MIDTIHQSFIDAAEKFPDNIAVFTAENQISYQTLNRRSLNFANWLIENNYAPGERIALVLPKSIEAIVAIFGILRAGSTYVPLGDGWPSSRINSILEIGAFKLLLTDSPDKDLNIEGINLVLLSSGDWREASSTKQPTKEPSIEVCKDDLAYILYTSGSTGVPKGVCVSHSAAFHFPDWAKNEIKIDERERVASIAPLTFDLSTFDLFTTLSAGASLYLVPEKHKLMPARFSQFLQDNKITTMYAVPSTLVLLMLRGRLKDRDLHHLKNILFAGEVFLPMAFKQLRECLSTKTNYYNLYGPTETNVCTFYKVDESYVTGNTIPIGQCVEGSQFYLRSDEGIIEPNISEGELCIVGPTVMSGYWGKADDAGGYWQSINTKGSDGDSERAYRTGDMVSINTEGLLEYKGRIDKMVKIWGYRVELGEVENCILNNESVEQTAVIKRSKKDGMGEELVAFLVADANHLIDKDQVFKHCTNNLTHYMVPRKLYELTEIPITSSGKVDRFELELMAKKFLLSE